MELALKQRLLGAAVLVALAVTFLPMLVTDPAPASGAADVPLRVPRIPDSDSQTREMPLVEPAAPAGAVLPTMAAPGDAANSAGSDATSAPAPGAAASSSAARLPATTAGGDYAVNFGSYATATDAGRVIAALRIARLPGYQEPVVLPARTVYRVRIGPYASQADAEAARLQAARVRDDVSAKVVVLDARPAGATPAAAPMATATLPTAQASTSATAAAKPSLPATSALPTAPKAGAIKPTAVKPAASTMATVAASPTGAGALPAGSATGSRPAGTTVAPADTGSLPVAAKPVAAKPATTSTGFAIQLGAFASADDANRLRDRARAAGFTAFVEPVRSEHGALNRVRIGPVADRADADRLRAQVSSKLGIDGIVRPHP